MAKKILSAKNDFIFKLIFGDYRNVDILAEFLSAVLDIPKEEYESITIVDPNLRMESEEDKLGILDVKIHTKSKNVIDIEIQVNGTPNFPERVVFYNSKMVVEQIGKSDSYGVIKKTISIIITDFDLIKDSNAYHNRYLLYDPRTKSTFTDKVEVNTLELGKIPDVSDSSFLWKWLQFLRTDGEEEVLSMLAEENNAIKKAVGILKELSEDERTRLLYEQREKAIRDYRNGIEGSYMEGHKEGIEEGIAVLVQVSEEEGFSSEKTALKIQEKFQMNASKAMEYYQKYKIN